MDVLHLHEHLNCFEYDRSPRPQIEILTFKQGQWREVFINANQIVFFMEGTIRQVLRGHPEYVNSAGQFIFLPCGVEISLVALCDSVVTVFRLDKIPGLCESFPLEGLHTQGYGDAIQGERPPVGCLHTNEAVACFLYSLNKFVSGGLRCRHFFNIKIREFFLILRVYYPREQLRDFFALILSADTAFSEYIRKNWDKYPTVRQLAASINMTPKQFSARFRKIFAETPYQWIKQSRARMIHRDLVAGQKSLKQIAAENGFTVIPQFTNFCKKELGASPSMIRKSRNNGI